MATFAHLSKRLTREHNTAAWEAPLGGVYKRTFDVIFAITALAATAVLFVVIIGALKLLSPGPVFFFHERIGFGGRRFRCIKFRTMVVDAESKLEECLAKNSVARTEFALNQKLRCDPRIVPGIGHFLRSTSLDELPQFINVLLGDMSIVGPRPVTAAEIDRYGAHQTTYLSVRPGITGLWQVSGRSNLPFEERVRLDVDYVGNWSVSRDVLISLRTLSVFFERDGAC